MQAGRQAGPLKDNDLEKERSGDAKRRRKGNLIIYLPTIDRLGKGERARERQSDKWNRGFLKLSSFIGGQEG